MSLVRGGRGWCWCSSPTRVLFLNPNSNHENSAYHSCSSGWLPDVRMNGNDIRKRGLLMGESSIMKGMWCVCFVCFHPQSFAQIFLKGLSNATHIAGRSNNAKMYGDFWVIWLFGLVTHHELCFHLIAQSLGNSFLKTTTSPFSLVGDVCHEKFTYRLRL